MKKTIIIAVLTVLAFSFIALSQLGTTIESVDKQECTLRFYEETKPVYSYVERTRDTHGTCYNPANSSNYRCINGTEEYTNYEQTGTRSILKNNSICRQTSFEITISSGTNSEKKKIDFSSWGTCIQETENDCVAIICGTLEGGSARNGIFNGCDGGKQCKKFLFCTESTRIFVKGSDPGFVEQSATYRLPALEITEVGQ